MPIFTFDRYKPKQHPLIRSVNIVKRTTPLRKVKYFAFDYSYLVFLYGGATIFHPSKGSISSPKAYVKSPRHYPFELSTKADCSYVVLILNPTAFYAMTRQYAVDSMDHFVPLQELISSDKVELLYEACKGKYDGEEVFETVDSLCHEQLEKWSEATPVDAVVEDIIAAKGQLKTEDILKKYPYSLSTLNRYFKKYIGMTVGLYIRLVKFSSLITTITETPHSKLKDIALEYDFADQSHFNRDFKQFAGISPKEFFGPEFELIQKSFGK